MRISPALVERMLDHCRAGLPNEACGLLAGAGGDIVDVYCIANADPSPATYTIEPEGHFRALMDAEARGLELVGAFHSHVDGPARPSATDIAGAAEPDWVWVVVGPMRQEAEVRAFRIDGDRAFEEDLVVGHG
ncbi:MAG: M67 family metallopeptidase [Acidimicrobiia bacterium]|nr:M67 family metallopeptidase [Acidimicrobiia bacterium]